MRMVHYHWEKLLQHFEMNINIFSVFDGVVCVEASAIKTEITDWQTKALDRERFQTLLSQAKTAICV